MLLLKPLPTIGEKVKLVLDGHIPCVKSYNMTEILVINDKYDEKNI